MSNIRRVTAEHLSYAWNTIPHVTQFDKADVTALEELRKKYKDQVDKAGGNLTVTAMLVKILATAVKTVPAVQRLDRHASAARSSTRSTSTSASPSTPTAGCSCR